MTNIQTRKASVWLASGLLIGGLALSGCATRAYVDEQITIVSGRVDAVDRKASDALARADAAGSAAQAAGAEAARAHQRIDALESRVGMLEQAPRRPRG